MNDDLGDIMYADSDDEMWGRWKVFIDKYCEEDKFIEYFEEEWLTQPGKYSFSVLFTTIFCNPPYN